MKIEDCKTLPEFFGVESGECIWVEGQKFDVYHIGINGVGNTLQNSQALVGCLTGQLKWSKHEPMTADEEFGSCTGCGYEFNSELISEYEIEYCPKCGQKIKGPMTEDEERMLRRIAAWNDNWGVFGLTNSGTIYVIYKVDKYYADTPFNNKDDGSKAYEVLAPILEKYGEINLDDYR